MLYEVITISREGHGKVDLDRGEHVKLLAPCGRKDVITSYSIHYTKLYDPFR